jgi:hypothetical protein
MWKFQASEVDDWVRRGDGDFRTDPASRDVGGPTYPDRLAIFQGRNHVDEFVV